MTSQTCKSCGYIISMGLVGALFAGALGKDATAQALKLDHFQCYEVFGPVQDAPAPVFASLEDQFDVSLGVIEDVEVGNVVRFFCNPTDKTFEGKVDLILNDDNHLTLYAFESLESIDINGEVKIFNQFGDQKLVIRSADIIAVPTRKLKPIRHLNGPENLDHFKCYFARGEPAKSLSKVGLKDQFAVHETKHKLGEPLLFCNPVDKETSRGITTIINRDAHLTCYEFKPPTSPLLASGIHITEVSIENQFTEGTAWKIGDGRLLCVPTEKLDFKVNQLN